jgi:hypothetical protein
MILASACGSDNPAEPSDGPVTVDFTLQVSRPSGVTSISEVGVQPAVQGLETRVQGTITVNGGTASLASSCSAQLSNGQSLSLPGLSFTRTFASGTPFSFNEVVDLELPFPSTTSGTLNCTLQGSASDGSTVNVSRQTPFTPDVFRPNPASCSTSDTTMCLLGGRFKVEVDWDNGAGQTGDGRVPDGGDFDDGGFFYFFNANAPELFIQMQNQCGPHNRFWVFFAATTNVEFTVTVTDTSQAVTREYVNPLGSASPAITETEAFATSP